MGYKILGYSVWHGAKWYLRGKVPGASRKPSPRAFAIAGVGGAVIAGAVLGQRRATTS
ncbi:MAG TPA: hypothetical protein VGF93_23380 [Solirubrobacteraceae bacterium]|jgi:hypothetical protein